MRDLKTCRIQDFDDIFYATKESQGHENAVLAIKYVLFDDDSVFEDCTPNENKYIYISSKNNARKKAMIMQKADLEHIMIKYCMASFGLRNRDFTITEDEFLIAQKRIDRLEISAYETIEAVAYAAIGNIELAFNFLFHNQKLLSKVVDKMIEDRYINNLKDTIDNFSGIINNDEMDSEKKYEFYDAYIHLDTAFEEIKKNDIDYII